MLNVSIIIGRLADDPKVKETKNGTKVVTFSLPLYHSYKPEGQEQKPEWIQCEAWGGLANIAELAKKGSLVVVKGELHKSTWQDEKEEWQSRPFIKIDSFRFLEPKNKNPKESNVEEQFSYDEEPPVQDDFFGTDDEDVKDFLDGLKDL